LQLSPSRNLHNHFIVQLKKIKRSKNFLSKFLIFLFILLENMSAKRPLISVSDSISVGVTTSVDGGDQKRQCTTTAVDNVDVPLATLTAEQLIAVLPATAAIYIGDGIEYGAKEFASLLSFDDNDMELLWLGLYTEIDCVYIEQFQKLSDYDTDNISIAWFGPVDMTYYEFASSFVDSDTAKHTDHWVFTAEHIAEAYVAHQASLNAGFRRAVNKLCI
jgi:hypothetical protein